MKKLLFWIILYCLFGVSVYAQKMSNKNFIGVFRNCFVHCSTYDIKADFTFEHRFSGRETFGTWKYVGKNKIKLYAPGKKAETVSMIGKNNNGEMVEFEMRIPKIRAFKTVLFIENDSVCTLFNKGKSKSCYQRIEPEKQSN